MTECNHEKTIQIAAEVKTFSASFEDQLYLGDVPEGMGLSGRRFRPDMIELSYCLNCGQIQSDAFPIVLSNVKNPFKN